MSAPTRPRPGLLHIASGMRGCESRRLSTVCGARGKRADWPSVLQRCSVLARRFCHQMGWRRLLVQEHVPFDAPSDGEGAVWPPGSFLLGVRTINFSCGAAPPSLPPNGTMSPHPYSRTLLACAMVALSPLALPSSSFAATSAASETITGGGLTFINASPSAVTFPSTALNGTDQTISQTQTLDISDARGSGAGWNVTATSTTFTNGGTPLGGATTMTSAPSAACDAGVSCVTPTNSVTYPYTLPAAGTAPLATKMYNAATNTGTGALTVTPTWRLLVPATASVGTYTSTWTLSLVSGP